jgi:hypothetical protein
MSEEPATPIRLATEHTEAAMKIALTLRRLTTRLRQAGPMMSDC